jgi:hypothetical protein
VHKNTAQIFAKKPHKGDVLGSPLGIDAKYSPSQKNQRLRENISFDEATGEVASGSSEYCPVSNRLERFALQSAARKILRGSSVKRVNNCLRVAQTLQKFDKRNAGVHVYKSVEHGTCSYGGLQTCASVWSCPVCAAKISERRKRELQKAIAQHTEGGGEVLLLTLTNPHYLGDKLLDVLDGQKKALEYFNKGGDVTRFNKSIGLIGQVRALEVTHGRLSPVNNGWHPHYHILLFVGSGLDLGALRASFYARWLKACVKAGLPTPSFEHGVRLDDGSKAAAYASKWGLESEMTKGHIKKARKGETPFDLLRAVLANNDKQAAALFREFSEVFKGKRQLHWSPGLKAKFDLVDVSDELLASKLDDDSALLGTIELEDWQLILKNDVRGEILELAVHGWEAVERFLVGLRGG